MCLTILFWCIILIMNTMFCSADSFTFHCNSIFPGGLWTAAKHISLPENSCPWYSLILLQFNECLTVSTKSGDTNLKTYETWMCSWKTTFFWYEILLSVYFDQTSSFSSLLYFYSIWNPSLWTHCLRCGEKPVNVIDFNSTIKLKVMLVLKTCCY